MAEHVRKQIRDRFVASVTGLKSTQDRVLIGRTRALGRDHEPTLLVYSTPAASGGQETSKPLSLEFPRLTERTMSLSVMGRVQSGEPPDDDLDEIARQVEVAALTDPTLGGLARDTVLSSTVSQVDAAGDRHEGAIRLVFSIAYFVKETAPDIAL